MGLAPLTEAVDELVEIDPFALGDHDTIQELHRQRARLDAVLTRATAAFDASGTWRDEGARSAAAMLAVLCRIPKADAMRRCRLGRELRHLPATEKAWLDGEINEAHVQVLSRARTERTADAMDESEAMLVGEATKLRFDQFVRVVNYWTQRADPDGAERAAKDREADRRYHLSRSFEGMWFGDFVLDPVRGAIFDRQHRRIEQELFEQDWAEARARLGDKATVADLRRTAAQRRADALVEMAVRAGTTPKDGRRPEPLFTVLLGWETFSGRVCELADGTVLAPGELVPWLDQAWLERVVFDGPSRVIDVGVRRRLFGGATRRAIEVRDRECFHRYCDVQADRCQGDHIEPWSFGGPTVQANGRLACGVHNRGRHGRRRP
jgi:hypothetical protein